VPEIEIHPVELEHESWAGAFLTERWGATVVVSRGRLHDALSLPGFVASLAGGRVGLATFRVEDDECELVTLDSEIEGRGVGSALIEAVKQEAVRHGCRRLWLITTNDNLHALRFYQRRGFRLVAVHRDAIERSRDLKPAIPLVGADGIPLRDEIELELPLLTPEGL
jgi:GNAT superfamily N-acetyltransferase